MAFEHGIDWFSSGGKTSGKFQHIISFSIMLTIYCAILNVTALVTDEKRMETPFDTN